MHRSGSGPAITVVADDLTGAADSAARCRHAGMQATILLSAGDAGRPRDGVVALSTDSRHLAPAQAYDRVAHLTRRLAQQASGAWYKKIDSTLRGNLGAEIDAMLEAIDGRHCVISPAFPAQRRGLRNGRLVHAGGEAIDLMALLAAQSRHSMHLLPLTVVEQGDAAIVSLFSQYATEATLFVVDALTDADLAAVLRAQHQALPGALLCGSAGLVAIYAREVTRLEHAIPALPPVPDSFSPIAAPRSTVLVSGSGSAMAHAQLRMLAAHGVGLFHCVDLDGAFEHAQPDTAVSGDASCTLHVLHQPRPAPDACLDGADARRRAELLAGVAQQLISRQQAQTLILVGGDTAISVLARLGVHELRVQRELLPGMPLTAPVPAPESIQHVILKAGNHGDEQTLLTLLAMIDPAAAAQ